ncbi:TPA: fimbrial protein [Providencia stuartii]|uniref:Fimbrial protein n=2 Tax=Providencia stuartii TaxID=588 RepID=A0AA86YUD3_PROST|nr:MULTISPECIES: fimbrial protein [Providencia]AFH95312.1 fimbrial protein [Providencia stuartii MRSN 2154]AIN63083.1 fimbrial family protein [Providencia stuartii]AMG66520.1 type 1 fimbrial protein [Providencia stuartii]APG53045.1 exotoxin [Providencia stuartii]AVL39357.1 type 1 fimbrial protein [Providencia stuartii]
MNIKRNMSFAFGLWFLGVTATFSANVEFDGTLIEDACDVYPGDESIELDFGTIVDKYLYLNTQTNSQPFTIRLINCDLALGHEVKVTFMGAESLALPGLLALDAGSQATGVAVGIESISGTAIKINSGSYTQGLYAGNNNDLRFQAYVRAEPVALQNKSIVLGSWAASATFKLDYE